jgi:hypothetical protein
VPQQLLLPQEGAGVTAIVIGGAAGAPLVVRVAPYASEPAPCEAVIGVAVRDPALAAAMTRAIVDAVASVAGAAMADVAVGDAGALPSVDSAAGSPLPTLRVRSRKRLAARAADAAGAIAIVPVTARNARHLIAIIDAARAAGACGIQLVWDGATPPPRATVERHVFAALEHARATPAASPVVLAARASPAAALQLVIAVKGSR